MLPSEELQYVKSITRSLLQALPPRRAEKLLTAIQSHLPPESADIQKVLRSVHQEIIILRKDYETKLV